MKSDIPVKPVTAQWTDDQWKAIHAKNQDILVAAAAGSGKTAVLVERIIQKIVSKEMNVVSLLFKLFIFSFIEDKFFKSPKIQTDSETFIKLMTSS